MNEWLAARNILAVRLDNIGDVIMLGPALRAVKETPPQARLTLLASPAGATAAPLLPWIDDVIVWRASWQDVGGRILFNPAHELKLINLLSERSFDAAFYSPPPRGKRPGTSLSSRAIWDSFSLINEERLASARDRR